MAEFTPGPWEWWTSNSWRRLRRSERGKTTNILMPFVCYDGQPDISVSQADMKLIAAAPDLLAELKTSYCPGDFSRTVEECMASRECGCSSGAAVAKATEPRP